METLEMFTSSIRTHVCSCMSFHTLEPFEVLSFKVKEKRFGLRISERLHPHTNIKVVNRG